MDLAIDDKLKHLTPYIKSGAKIVSIGAGTGLLEETIAKSDPTVAVYALDFSTEMIDRIRAKKQPNLKAVWANALDLKSHDELQTADVVIASSVIHEFASFLDNFQFGEKTGQILSQIAGILKPGGVFIIRDFVAPEFSDRPVKLITGKAQDETEMDPAEFVARFAREFRGFPTPVDPGKVMTFMEGMEFLTHYSWQQSFVDEVKERYFYLSLKNYSTFVDQFGFKTVSAQSYLQDGYLEHVSGRLSLVDAQNNPVYFPPITGVMVFKKICLS